MRTLRGRSGPTLLRAGGRYGNETQDMSPEAELMSWLRNAHAMEVQAIQLLENQARRIDGYPELRHRIVEHLEGTRTQYLQRQRTGNPAKR